MRSAAASSARNATALALRRALLVSSFVRPHQGGVEEFVEATRTLLEEQGWSTRTVACRVPGLDASADAVVPTRFLGQSSWPVPTGGWRTLWREVGAADLVIANGARQFLPVLAVLAARARGRAALLVIHGSGDPQALGSWPIKLGRSLFERTLALLAVRLSRPVSLTRAGVRGLQKVYGVAPSYLPYPIRELPPVPEAPTLSADEPLRVAWVGRLFPEKNPVLAVDAVEVARRRREAVLHMCGDGHLRSELERLARRRPWLVLHGTRSWEDVQTLQGSAHACLATSVAEGAHLAVLEPLCRGIPTVSTRVGDAPAYYNRPAIRNLCVPSGDAESAGRALLDIASSYERQRVEFAANASILRARHAAAGEALAALAETAISHGPSTPPMPEAR
jgi:glycosyltransferase involved in cell wall biosynthesis